MAICGHGSQKRQEKTSKLHVTCQYSLGHEVVVTLFHLPPATVSLVLRNGVLDCHPSNTHAVVCSRMIGGNYKIMNDSSPMANCSYHLCATGMIVMISRNTTSGRGRSPVVGFRVVSKAYLRTLRKLATLPSLRLSTPLLPRGRS